jgi:hypothetical protein
MKKLGGRTMKKLVLLVVVLVMAQLSYGLSSVTYTCDFEQGEQGTSFTTGKLYTQGTPAWNETYYGGDLGGSVISTDSYSGSQSAVVSGYQASFLDMGGTYIPKWIEFAIKPQFAPYDEQAGNYQIAKVFTTRGPYYDIFGLYMYLDSSTGNIQVWNYENLGFVDCGPYTNNAWQTISLRNDIVEYPEESGEFVYTGAFDVWVDGVKVANHLGYTGAAYCFETLIFFTSESTWAHGGTLGFDGINIGDSYIYAPEPATMGLLAMGLGFIIRRKRA